MTFYFRFYSNNLLIYFKCFSSKIFVTVSAFKQNMVGCLRFLTTAAGGVWKLLGIESICEHVKVDVHGENIAFFIVSYDFPSFFLPFFLLSIGSKIWVCWENGNFRSEKWENGNPNYANRKGFQKVTFGYFTSRIQSTCAVRLRFSKFALDLLKSP